MAGRKGKFEQQTGCSDTPEEVTPGEEVRWASERRRGAQQKKIQSKNEKKKSSPPSHTRGSSIIYVSVGAVSELRMFKQFWFLAHRYSPSGRSERRPRATEIRPPVPLTQCVRVADPCDRGVRCMPVQCGACACRRAALTASASCLRGWLLHACEAAASLCPALRPSPFRTHAHSHSHSHSHSHHHSLAHTAALTVPLRPARSAATPSPPA